MTSISLTYGQISEIVGSLVDREFKAVDNEDPQLAQYYRDIAIQFATVLDKLDQLPGEQREANLILAMN
jgi:GTP-binding protein EngB required for normal cell division